MVELPIEEALSGWVAWKRGKTRKGEEGESGLGRRIFRGNVESREVLIVVVDIYGVKINFGLVPEGMVIRKVMIGVIVEVSRGGG